MKRFVISILFSYLRSRSVVVRKDTPFLCSNLLKGDYAAWRSASSTPVART